MNVAAAALAATLAACASRPVNDPIRALDPHSYDQVELVKDMVDRWGLLRDRSRLAGLEGWPADPSLTELPKIEFYPVDLSFERIADPEQRRRFMNLPRASCSHPRTSTRCGMSRASCCATTLSTGSSCATWAATADASGCLAKAGPHRCATRRLKAIARRSNATWIRSVPRRRPE